MPINREEIRQKIREIEENIVTAEKALRILRRAGVPNEQLEQQLMQYKAQLKALKKAIEEEGL